MDKDWKIKQLELEIEELRKDKKIKELELELEKLKNGEKSGIYYPSPQQPYNPYNPNTTPQYPRPGGMVWC